MRPLVIKVGGAFLDSDEHATALFAVIKQLQQDFWVTLVHGGGNGVQQLLADLNLPSDKLTASELPGFANWLCDWRLGGYSEQTTVCFGHQSRCDQRRSVVT